MPIKHHVRDQLIQILGPNGFSDVREDRLGYAYDATTRQYLPDAVAMPENAAQVSQLLQVANEHRLPVTPRGAGSGLTGGSLPVHGGLTLALNRMKRILQIDTDNLFAEVEPGVVTAVLHAAVERKGLFYPPDPASMTFCTIGGNIAENAGGMRAVKYGVTRNYIMGLEVVLPTGQIIHTGSKCIKDVVGYDMTTLFVGSEGTLGVVTKAILRLLPLPEARQTLTAAFPTLRQAAHTITDIIRQRIVPATLEFLDHHCIRAVEHYLKAGLPADAQAFLLIDVDGAAIEIPAAIEKIRTICNAHQAIEVRIAENAEQQDRLWKIRRSISPALGYLPLIGDHDDISVPRSRIPDFVETANAIADRYGLYAVCFGHAGDGNIHLSLATQKQGARDEDANAARRQILQAAVGMEGRIAAEHGIGLLKKEKLSLNIDPASIDAMRAIKRIFDPNNILNPGKIFPSYQPPNKGMQ